MGSCDITGAFLFFNLTAFHGNYTPISFESENGDNEGMLLVFNDDSVKIFFGSNIGMYFIYFLTINKLIK